MSVPERLALIGGSILLASLLIFTLKDEVSKLIPGVFNNISGLFSKISQAPAASESSSGQ